MISLVWFYQTNEKEEMKAKDIVKFNKPVNEDEKKALMVVIDTRDDRVLVSDLRFSDWSISPTDVYPVNDLEFVTKSSEKKIKNCVTP